MGKKIRIGIVGAGTIGSVHAEAYKKVADAELVGLCDILPDKLKEKAAKHGIPKTYATHQEMLADPEIDAISVCVPNCSHAPIAIDALNAGKHVMLEKPMTLNANLGRDILKARDASGKVLQMGMVRRQYPESQLIHKYINEGKLGEIYQINIKLIRRRGIPGLGGWFTTKAMSGGGALIDIAVHFLDLAMWSANLWNPTRVSAKTYSKFGSPMKSYHYNSMWAGPPNYDGTFDVDDYVAGMARFGKNATMSFQVAWACNAKEEQTMEILGTKGGVKSGEGELILRTEMDEQIVDIKPIFNAQSDAFATELTKFVAAINGEGEIPATGEQGVIVMQLLDAIYKSSELDQEVTI